MKLTNTYIAAANLVFNEKWPRPTGGGITYGAKTTATSPLMSTFPSFAADAAQAALTQARVYLSELGPVYHVADLPASRSYMAPAADLVRAAKLPVGGHPLITMSAGSEGILDAITSASCYLNRVGMAATWALVTAGDVWPEQVPYETHRLNAGAALVVSTDTGHLELTAVATASDPKLMTPISHASEYAIRRDQTEALLERVADEALHDAQVGRDELDQVITHLVPRDKRHAALLRRIGACTDTLPPDADPDATYYPADAVTMIDRFAPLCDPATARPVGTPILVVADSGHGTASAAVIRVA